MKNSFRREFPLKLKAYSKSNHINSSLRIGKGLSVSES